MINIFLNYNESDSFAKDMILGYSFLNKHENKVQFETDINNINNCNKILILRSAKNKTPGLNIKNINKNNIATFSIHEVGLSQLDESNVKNWSLPNIFRFCLNE